MTEFTKRGEAFEGKFAHEQALRFKAIARRNKLFGLWAAQQLGKTGADAEAYARTVVISDLDEPGDEDVIRKVVNDLKAADVPCEEGSVRSVLEEFMFRSIDEIKAGV
ncbi:DUF1476 domain-containing protein [Bradyrhizobium sp. UFLA05-153]